MREKIVFACRPGAGSALIAYHLSKAELLDAIIIEAGGKAKTRKLRKIKNNAKWWKWPIVLVDLGCLLIYQKVQAIKIRNFVCHEIGTIEFPEIVPQYNVDDINDSDCLERLKKMQPCTLIVFGSSILKEQTIETVEGTIYNIHGGIVPKYRNVHSELWAYINRDFTNIGVTIMYLDSGIDTGDIALQQRITVGECCSIFDVKIKNLQLSYQLIIDVLMNKNAVKTRIQQDKTKQKIYPTPGGFQFFKLLFLAISRQIQCIIKPSSKGEKQSRR